MIISASYKTDIPAFYFQNFLNDLKNGYVDWKNRSGTKYLCSSCGYTANADNNAALNILERFITGPYNLYN